MQFELRGSDREIIEDILSGGIISDDRIRIRLCILLRLEKNKPREIASAIGVSVSTVYLWKKRYLECGINPIIYNVNYQKSVESDSTIQLSNQSADTVRSLVHQIESFVAQTESRFGEDVSLVPIKSKLEDAKQVLLMHSVAAKQSLKIQDRQASSETHTTLGDIAKVVGVSRMTVSRALRGISGVAYEKQIRIEQVARDLNYETLPYVSFFQSYVKSFKKPKFQGTIGWIDDWNEQQKNWWSEDWNRKLLEEAKKRAEKRGFKISKICLQMKRETVINNTGRAVKQLTRIANARGVHGIILPNLHYLSLAVSNWKDLSVVSIGDKRMLYEKIRETPGYSSEKPPSNPSYYHTVLPNYYDNFSLAWENIIKRGYKRPGLFLTVFRDHTSNFNFRRQFVYFQSTLSEKHRIPPLVTPDDHNYCRTMLKDWAIKYRPDVIICQHAMLPEWLEAAKIRPIADVGMVHLGITDQIKDWSGVITQQAQQARAAVDLVISQLRHLETGSPMVPQKIMIPGVWNQGKSLPTKL